MVGALSGAEAKNAAGRIHRATTANIQAVDNAMPQTINTVKFQLYDDHSVSVQMEWLAERDPNNPNHAANVFLHPQNSAEKRQWLENRLALVQSAANFNAAFGRRSSDKLAALLDERRAAHTRFLDGIEIATSKLTLPTPKSDDLELAAIAKDILARPKYEFGEHGPIKDDDETSHIYWITAKTF